jgi:hypothetical protein
MSFCWIIRSNRIISCTYRMSARNFDSSTLTKLNQARANAFFITRQNLLTSSSPPNNFFPSFNPQSGNFDATQIQQLHEGNFTTYTKNFGLLTRSVPPSGLLPFPLISGFVDPPIPIDETVLYAFQSILTYSAASNYGPTFMSRFLYVWFMTVVGSWNWVQESPALIGVKDQWNWDTQYPLNYDDSTIWMVLAINYIMPLFITTNIGSYYNTDYLLKRTLDCHGWTAQELRDNIERVQTDANWTGWTTALNTWLTYRNADGHLTAKVPGPLPGSPNAQYRNGSTRLNPATSQDFTDTSQYPEPLHWTPLVINGANKLYATPRWNEVTSTCLTAQNEEDLSGLAAPFFPDASDRQIEIADLVNKTATLTDSEKITAEWWAGGPYTVTPPGQLMWYWKTYMTTYNVATTHNIRAFMLSGLEATIGLFEAGRVVWGQKLGYTQSRPIQEIRRTYRGQRVTGYDGQGVSGELWMPYQEANFITPPFPDFTSGHSAYSKIFADVMGEWFGDAIDTSKTANMSDLNLVTADLSAPQQNPFGTVIFPTGSSLIQPGVVPAQPTTLSFTSWSQLASSAGISRQYGGIHASSAHAGSLAIVAGLYPLINSYWGI